MRFRTTAKNSPLLSGQKPVVTRSKKAISNFKLREDQPIGLMVTLRGKRMYDFLDRFCNIVSPRIRDFRGFNKKGDGRGNYNFGIEDQQIFPEINLDEVKRAQGMNITLVTTAKNDADCIELLPCSGFRLSKRRNMAFNDPIAEMLTKITKCEKCAASIRGFEQQQNEIEDSRDHETERIY